MQQGKEGRRNISVCIPSVALPSLAANHVLPWEPVWHLGLTLGLPYILCILITATSRLYQPTFSFSLPLPHHLCFTYGVCHWMSFQAACNILNLVDVEYTCRGEFKLSVTPSVNF